MTASPSATTVSAARAAASSHGPPPLHRSRSLLMTDEVYREPATIGQVLPLARIRYLQWVRQTQQRASFTEYDNDNGEDDYDEDDKEPNPSNWSLLRTMEHFPSKYLIDPESESESETEQEPSPTTPSSTPTAGASTRKRPRKTQNLFDPPPPPASNSFGIVDRWRIQKDASLYAMLRAWVRDDFQEPQEESVPTTAFPRGARKRKTLSDYTATATATATATSGDGSASSSRLRSPLPPPPPPPQRHVDILGWLDQDPQRRPYTPCYPTLQETRDSQARLRAQHTAKTLRRQRLRATQKSLRRKGIFL